MRDRIGLYGSGEVPRSGQMRSASSIPSRDFLRDVKGVSMLASARKAGSRRKTAMVASAFIPLIAVATIVFAGALVPSVSLVPLVPATSEQQPPPLPFVCFLTVYDGVGGTIDGVHLNVTDLTTGAYNNSLISGYKYTGEFVGGGFCQVDLIWNMSNTNPLTGNNFTVGDVIRVVALDPYSGTNEGSSDTGFPFMSLDLTVVVIPEFGDIVTPIVGMLGVFVAVVAVRAKRKAG